MVFQQLKNNSGFGWDDMRQIPTAPDHVWTAYLEKHPSAKEFRNHGLANYDALAAVFEGNVATGAHASGTAVIAPSLSSLPSSPAALSVPNEDEGYDSEENEIEALTVGMVRQRQDSSSQRNRSLSVGSGSSQGTRSTSLPSGKHVCEDYIEVSHTQNILADEALTVSKCILL